MGDSYGTVKVAAVQAASVFLDREGSTEKACRLIREAGENGARIIGFPEGFIPAHPVWYHHHAATGAVANKLAVELFKNAVEIPGPQTDALGEAARDANATVVMGVCEKLPQHHRHHVQHADLFRAGRHASSASTRRSCRRSASGWSIWAAMATPSARSRPSSARCRG